MLRGRQEERGTHDTYSYVYILLLKLLKCIYSYNLKIVLDLSNMYDLFNVNERFTCMYHIHA